MGGAGGGQKTSILLGIPCRRNFTLKGFAGKYAIFLILRPCHILTFYFLRLALSRFRKCQKWLRRPRRLSATRSARKIRRADRQQKNKGTQQLRRRALKSRPRRLKTFLDLAGPGPGWTWTWLDLAGPGSGWTWVWLDLGLAGPGSGWTWVWLDLGLAGPGSGWTWAWLALGLAGPGSGWTWVWLDLAFGWRRRHQRGPQAAGGVTQTALVSAKTGNFPPFLQVPPNRLSSSRDRPFFGNFLGGTPKMTSNLAVISISAWLLEPPKRA
jgi:hypothetical protein